MLPLLAGDRTLRRVIVAAETPIGDAADASTTWPSARPSRSRTPPVPQPARREIVERRQAEAKLQESNRRKDEFLAMLSHELRNPLAPIRNAVEVIRRIAPADPKLGWASDVIDRQVTQLTRLVDDLLDVARISQGKIDLQLEPVDLRRRHRARRRDGAPVHRRAPPPARAAAARPGRCGCAATSARLSQVVANLLNNAAKYTEEGGQLELSLSVRRAARPSSRVRDNGIGIDAELLPHVFDLFTQGKRSLDRSQGGLGVGLTLVRRLVELHQRQRAKSHSAGPGQGAEFRVRLPCLDRGRRADGGRAGRARAAGAAAAACWWWTTTATRPSRWPMFLGMVGHAVKTVNDGKEALACAPVYAPQVVRARHRLAGDRRLRGGAPLAAAAGRPRTRSWSR